MWIRRIKVSQEKPLNIEQFFMTRNEVATRAGGKLELQAMSNIRKYMVEERAKNVRNQRSNKKNK